MALSITGYILDPVRVGSSNSPFTLTPDNYISDEGAFEAAYPSTELAPRTEYLVQVLAEAVGGGTGPDGKVVLADAVLAWTKNEGEVQGGLQVPFERFGYADQDGRFKTLPGAPREAVGVLSPSANTTRLVVAVPPLLTNLTTFPIRVGVGASGSGTTFPVTLVSGAFGSPGAGTVELDTITGELNWNTGDLATLNGAPVTFQRQAFYPHQESNGNIGLVGEVLLLSPLPATGQYPALKIGERSYLTPVERANEAAFSTNPTAGTVEWARTTGRLKLNATDSATFAGQPFVYDGVFFKTFQVARQTIGLAQGTPAGTLSIYAPEGSDLHFRISGVVQFPATVFVDSFTSGAEGQVQVRRSDGAVQLSATDRAKYTGQTVQAVSPDIEIEPAGAERGHVLRLFRTVVDPGATNPAAKDVSAVYAQEDAILADPIVGQPFVTLPALPLEDQTLVVSVEQGTGSFLGYLNRLDVASPAAGKGYLLDFDSRQLTYAERKALQVLPTPVADFAMMQLPNAPVLNAALSIELETAASSGVYQTLTQDQDFVIDLASGVITYTETSGESLVSGTALTISANTITVSESLIGVQPGDLLLITSGAAKGLYTILSVPTGSTATVSPSFHAAGSNVPYEIRRGKEVVVDRFFRDIPPVDPDTSVERLRKLGPISNGPRLNINAALASQSRFRFGKTTFSAVTSTVTSFTAPGILPQGTVEVDQETGDLNFSQADLTAGGDVYWSRELALGVEYTIQPVLGFVEFADRMLEREEVYLRYKVLTGAGTEVSVEERGAFLVPKEVTQAHPSPASTLSFNPDGREVAASPSPSAFRGGRPQSSSQVTFNVAASTVTFLQDKQVTDALPHGAVVQPQETVYVDYYVHEALGGEKNLTVTQFPMATAQVVITAENDAGTAQTSFTLKGDRTADFPASCLMRVASSEVYLLAAPTFNGTLTTVNLDQGSPQVLRSDFTNPTLEVTSGATRRLSAGQIPAYFVTESAPYDPIARGQKQLRLQGDLARVYPTGVIVCLTDSVSFQEYFFVEGSAYDSDANRTLVTLASGVTRQHDTSTLLRTVRPILEGPSGTVSTAHIPLLTLPFQAYRQVEGQIGQLLTRGVDYTLDESGAFAFEAELGLNEEIGLLYTGTSLVEAGRRTRASWTFTLVPSLENGLLNQVLTMDYSTYAPDTFFYRVETMTNFRGEVVEQFREDAKASSPSQGPTLENSSSAQLFEKGAESLYFTERDLANQDIIARATLKYYNDAIDGLEDWLQVWDGRAVGDHDGRFIFDGLIDNPIRASFASATNQIDDRIQIKSRVRRAFEAAPYSRFYPTRRSRYGAADDPTSLETGDPILDLGETALRQVSSVRNRFPWAVVTEATTASGTTLQVDHAQGDAFLSRPGLNVVASLQVAIIDRDGTVIVADSSPAVVASTTATSVTFTAPVPPVPQGATVRMATTDTTYRKSYLVGFDVGVDLDNGFLTHIESEDAPPNPPFPPNSSPAAGVLLDVLCQVGATETRPERFPALDGGITDDDGDRQFPVLSVDPHAELSSIQRELGLIQSGGTLRDATSSSLVGTGTLSAAGVVLTNGSGSWPGIDPKVGDLVRLLTSSEGTSYYHRITSVGASTVNVEPAFTATTGSVSFEITRGAALVSSVGSLSSTTVLTDAGGNFIANGVLPGHTVVGTAGTFIGQRRQVVTVTSATSLVVEAFTGTGAITYEVVDSLATFGGAGSLQLNWESDVAEELRALEGQDFVDFSGLVVEEAATQTLTVAGVAMGGSDALVVFVALDNNGGGGLGITTATFNGAPLTAQLSANTPGASNLGLFVYTATGVAGVTGSLVVTATDTSVSLKVYALKLSSIKAITVVDGITTTAPATLSPSASIASREVGDLILSFACSRVTTNNLFPVEDHNTLIPRFSGSGIAAILRASRATAAKQTLTSTYRVQGTSDTSRLAVVVISKDVEADVIPMRPPSEKAALEAFFDLVVPDRGLGDVVGAITSSTAIAGDFSNLTEGDVLYIRHGANAGVYTIASATLTSATVVEPFPASPETGVTFRAGDLRVPSAGVLQTTFEVLRNVEEAIASAGNIAIQQHCPVLVYRNGTPAGNLAGTSDSAFTSSSGVLTVAGGRARPISSPTTRANFILARSTVTDADALESALGPTEKLYDGRYVWIDGRINLETGILPKATRAVQNRSKALEAIVTNLTKLLAV